MTLWVKRIQNWALDQSPDHPVMVVHYEDLKLDPVKEVRRMLQFLDIRSESLSQRLKEDFTTFRRPHGDVPDFQRYTSNQTYFMKSMLLRAAGLAEESNMTHILRLEEYLEKFD